MRGSGWLTSNRILCIERFEDVISTETKNI